MFCFVFSLQPLSAVLGISIVRQGRFLKLILFFLDLLEQVTEKQLWERPSLVLPRVYTSICFTSVYSFCICMCIQWGQKRTYKFLFSLSAMRSLMNNLKLPSLVASVYTCSSISLDFVLVLFLRQAHYVALAGLQLREMCLPLPQSWCWDWRHAPPQLLFWDSSGWP